MFPTINLANPPLDTSLFFANQCYDFYALKQGVHSMKRSRMKLLESNGSMRGRNITKSVLTNKHKSNRNIKQEPIIDCNMLPVIHQKRNKTIILEQKLFNEIKNDDQEESLRIINFSAEKKFSKYSSEGIQKAEEWGSNKTHKTIKLNAFGRKIKIKKPLHVVDRTRESLERLVSSDIKLYIPSQKKYMSNLSKNMVCDLLLQSDTGAKYRTPIGF